MTEMQNISQSPYFVVVRVHEDGRRVVVNGPITVDTANDHAARLNADNPAGADYRFEVERESTPAPAATNLRIGNGNAVHVAYGDLPRCDTGAGARGRSSHKTSDPVTCMRCLRIVPNANKTQPEPALYRAESPSRGDLGTGDDLAEMIEKAQTEPDGVVRRYDGDLAWEPERHCARFAASVERVRRETREAAAELASATRHRERIERAAEPTGEPVTLTPAWRRIILAAIAIREQHQRDFADLVGTGGRGVASKTRDALHAAGLLTDASHLGRLTDAAYRAVGREDLIAQSEPTERHYARFDTTVCPDPVECEDSVIHGGAMLPGECCECCGETVPDEPTPADHPWRDANLAAGLPADYMCGCPKGDLLGPCKHAVPVEPAAVIDPEPAGTPMDRANEMGPTPYGHGFANGVQASIDTLRTMLTEVERAVPLDLGEVRTLRRAIRALGGEV